jgi:hypothetical protein
VNATGVTVILDPLRQQHPVQALVPVVWDFPATGSVSAATFAVSGRSRFYFSVKCFKRQASMYKLVANVMIVTIIYHQRRRRVLSNLGCCFM